RRSYFLCSAMLQFQAMILIGWAAVLRNDCARHSKPLQFCAMLRLAASPSIIRRAGTCHNALASEHGVSARPESATGTTPPEHGDRRKRRLAGPYALDTPPL